MKTSKTLKLYIDEAGRGPLAGPLYVGVVFPVKRFIKKDFKDSKSISEKKRKELLNKIQKLVGKGSVITGVGVVDAQEIDDLKITKSINLAIRRALLQIFKSIFQQRIFMGMMKCSCDIMDRLTVENLLSNPSEQERPILIEKMQEFIGKIELVIDGKHDFGLAERFGLNTTTIIKGDQKNRNIAMASILAKVSRDTYVVDVMDKKFPEYNFAQHKGYGTVAHRISIAKYGPCIYHRKFFLKGL